MRRLAFALAWAALVAAPMAACDDVGDCPASSQIKPGGSCSGDQLECPYTLQNAPSPACDGTLVDGGLQTSCMCQRGTWSCPSPASCDGTASSSDGGGDATFPNDAPQSEDVSDGANATDAPPDSAGDAARQ
jgi:hypothetical protein